MAGCRAGEVRADYANRLVAIALDESLARFSTHRGIGVELADPVGMSDLNRMVDHVAGDDCVLTARRNPHAGVTGGMSRGRFEYNVTSQPMSVLHQLRTARFNDRSHGIIDGHFEIGHTVVFVPMLPLALDHQVLGLGKSRHPLAVLEGRVPADMIEVQMSSQDRVDRVTGDTRFLEVLEERQMKMIPILEAGPSLVVADASIDQDTLAFALD